MPSIYDCPYCGATNLGEPQYSHLIDDQSYCEVVTCMECGKEYHHIYQLVRVDTFKDKE